jgi:hypothetical protein
MVLSVCVIQLAPKSNQNATSLSFVALDKSIKAAEEWSTANASQTLAPSQKRKKRTFAMDFKVLKGMRTPLHQSRYPLMLFLETPGAQEFPKVDTVG